MNEYEHPLFGPVIYSYTRAQALADSVLHDVSEMAREAGFTWPVAVTAEVLAVVNNIPPNLQGIQSYEGRMWDVLYLAHWAAKRGGTETIYELLMDRNEDGKRVKKLRLKMVVGPGDDLNPCITIMREWED